MKTMTTLIGTLAVALFTTMAVAGDDTDKQSKRTATAKFDKLDSDRDGKVSKDEAAMESTLSAQFASIDQDADGYVSKSEYTAMAQSSRTERRPSDYSRETPRE